MSDFVIFQRPLRTVVKKTPISIDYCDFEDTVLLESPFAQTTREGKGIRQVQLGLTPTKLIIAEDFPDSYYDKYFLNGHEGLPLCDVAVSPELDPAIETLELVSVIPIECVNLSIFHRRRKRTIKARFCNGSVLYFELGGFCERKLWKIYGKLPEERKNKMVFKNDLALSNIGTERKTWVERDLFFTDLSEVHDIEREEELQNNKNCDEDDDSDVARWTLSKEVEMNLINERNEDSLERFVNMDDPKRKRESKTPYLVHRFGCGIDENCGIGLYLYPMKNDEWELSNNRHQTKQNVGYMTFENIMNLGVKIWEEGMGMKAKTRHLRRFGINPWPQFYHGYGPFWDTLTKGERNSVQLKRIVSATELHEKKSSEFILPLTKRELTATISCESLASSIESSSYRQRFELILAKYPYIPPSSDPILFWTTDLSYHPKSSRLIYFKQRKVLKRFLWNKDHFYVNAERKINNIYQKNSEFEGKSDKHYSQKNHYNLKSTRTKIANKVDKMEFFDREYSRSKSRSLQIKRHIRLRFKITAWDFDSTTIAYQLTMIDRDLFLQIPVRELGMLIQWKSHTIEKSFLWPLTKWHRGTPCIDAFIAFSHRISCLTASEILKTASVKARARLITRFINIANKCFKLQNFQSCHSIISGLQSPAIYRLHHTWRYVKLRHAIKYEIFGNLCNFYKVVHRTGYENFKSNTLKGPFLPCINSIIYMLLNESASTKLDASSFIHSRNTGNKSIGEIHEKTGSIQRDISNNTFQILEKSSSTESKTRIDPSNHRSSTLKRFWFALRNILSTPGRRRKASIREDDMSEERSDEQRRNICKKAVDPNFWIKKTPVLYDCFSSDEVKEYISSLSFSRFRNRDTNFESTKGVIYQYQMDLLNHAVEMLLLCQCSATRYMLTQNELACEYLFKARYKEHNENFSFSIEVEKTS